MDSVSILIAAGSDILLKKLKTFLVQNGYRVVEQAKEGNECLRKMRTIRPFLAVLDYDIPVINGFELARIAVEDNLCEVILIASSEQRNQINHAKLERDIIVVTKPLVRENFLDLLELVIRNRRRILKLEKEINELKETLEARKVIERAKGILMKNLGLTEDEAYRRLQKQSMDRGIPLKDIAKAIILAYDI
ncbi:MAG TPA: ANTAR domain-containing protein [Clostridiaceae bacterium]|nr:ANTAR domain-containing protein [Clostridiaceae bacterium]